MPTYDLFCEHCDYKEEYLSQVMTIEVDRKCPTCNVNLLKRVGLIPSIFKGSGFYATEYGKSKGNSYRKEKGEDKSEIAEREKFIEEAKKLAP